MRIGVKTEKSSTENSMTSRVVFNKIWFFFLEKNFKVIFLISKTINRKKNFIRQHYVLLLFCELYRLSTLQMKIKKLNYNTRIIKK